MDANRLKVLEMVAEGKISVDDAERLLDRLKAAGNAEAGDGSGGGLDSGDSPENAGGPGFVGLSHVRFGEGPNADITTVERCLARVPKV